MFMKFVKIKLNCQDLMPYWWEYDETTPIYNATLKNMGFGKNSGNDLTGCEIVEAKSWLDLDWKDTKVYSDVYHTGWVSTNGKFYGCDFEFHDAQALLVHKLSSRELEQKGFIKITKKIRSDEYIVLNASKVNALQYKWFKDNYVLSNRQEVMDYLNWRLKMNLSANIEKEGRVF